jgi:hypothetical protein
VKSWISCGSRCEFVRCGGWTYRVCREEDHIMAEDASPYDRCELCSSVSYCVFAVL